jgi:hypothetical protein
VAPTVRPKRGSVTLGIVLDSGSGEEGLVVKDVIA